MVLAGASINLGLDVIRRAFNLGKRAVPNFLHAGHRM